MKSKLPVMWRANAKAWVLNNLSRSGCIKFLLQVSKYLQENEFPSKCPLLLDNVTAHPPGLEEDLVNCTNFIQDKFLPPNTTRILQRIDQLVISDFKKLYTKSQFWKCFEITNDTELTLRVLKGHFHILNSINLIYSAWNQVCYRTMNSAWKKPWPECIPDRDLDRFEAKSGSSRHSQTIVDDSTIIDDIVTIKQSMGLEVDADDIEELLEDHSIELTTEELRLLQK